MTVTPGPLVTCFYCEEQVDRWDSYGRYLRAVGFRDGRPELRVWCGNCGGWCEEHDEVEGRDDCFTCEVRDTLAADPIDLAARAALLRIGVDAVTLWGPGESSQSFMFDPTFRRAPHV